MLPNHDDFVLWIHERRIVTLSFIKLDGTLTDRTCAPLDYGPFKNHEGDKYHFMDLGDGGRPHVMGLAAHQIVAMIGTDQQFIPSRVISWIPNWHVPRNW